MITELECMGKQIFVPGWIRKPAYRYPEATEKPYICKYLEFYVVTSQSNELKWV